jgi:fumarate hydratase class II
VVKSGRTHLMDATPVTLGQEFGGTPPRSGTASSRVEATIPRVAELPLGGTAVGTGINYPAGGSPARVSGIIVRATGLPLTEAPGPLRAQGARAAWSRPPVRCAPSRLMPDTSRPTALRWLGSADPGAGLGEIALPDCSRVAIMPGKENPVICEATTMDLCPRMIGNDAHRRSPAPQATSSST